MLVSMLSARTRNLDNFDKLGTPVDNLSFMPDLSTALYLDSLPNRCGLVYCLHGAVYGW
jgi:hypothetical protein